MIVREKRGDLMLVKLRYGATCMLSRLMLGSLVTPFGYMSFFFVWEVSLDLLNNSDSQ